MTEVTSGEIPQQSSSIKEITPIQENRNLMLQTKGEIKRYVEPPLVNACETWWDKNVRTFSSSANLKDVGHEAYVILDYNSLSDKNKETARSQGEFIEDYDGVPAVKIQIPVTDKTTSSEIHDRFSELAAQYDKQKATWIPSYTLTEMKQIYAVPPEENIGIGDFVVEGYFYDPEGQKFYLSEEHYLKTKE